jgi:transcription initiation factor TFIIB
MTILQKIEEIKLICNNCSISRPVTDDVAGEITCSSCGYVISENAEGRVEPKFFLDNSDSIRTSSGSSPKMHDNDSTIIGVKNEGSVGIPLSASVIQTFSRLRKWDSRSQTKRLADSNLRDALHIQMMEITLDNINMLNNPSNYS